MNIKTIIQTAVIFLLLPIASFCQVAWVSPTEPTNCNLSHYYSLSNAMNDPSIIEIRVDVDYHFDPVGSTIVSGDNRSSHLSVLGGWSNCGDSSPTGFSTIEPTNGTGSVIEINGTNGHDIYIRNFEIQNGEGANGGGLLIKGHAQVTLVDTEISNNNVLGIGGGIALINDENETPLLYILPGTSVEYNTAGIGGGIACYGGQIHFYGGNIYRNQALNSYHAKGAGLFLDNCLVTHKTIPGLSADLNIHHNIIPELDVESISQNSSGGGLFITNGSQVSLGRTDAITQISYNSLYTRDQEIDNVDDHPFPESFGGGIYASNNSHLSLLNVKLDNNKSLKGGGIAIKSNAHVNIDATPMNCVGTDICSQVINNSARGYKFDQCYITGLESIHGGQGGAFWVNNATLTVKNTLINNNSVTQHEFDYSCAGNEQLEKGFGGVAYVANGSLNISNSLITENHAQYGLLDLGEYAQIEMIHNTITNNQDNDGGAQIITMTDDTSTQLTVANSILYDNALEVVDRHGLLNYTAHFYCNIVPTLSDINTHGNGYANLVATPSFIGNGDYQLNESSAAVDLCGDAYVTPDLYSGLNGLVRPVDHSKANVQGTYDAGAYENRNGNTPNTADLEVNVGQLSTAFAGSLIQAEIVVKNNGPFTSNNQIVNINTSGLTDAFLTNYNSNYWSCQSNTENTNIQCEGSGFPHMPAGASNSFTLTALVDLPTGGSTGVADISAKAIGDEIDSVFFNNQDTQSFAVKGTTQANFTLSISQAETWEVNQPQEVIVNIQHDYSEALPIKLQTFFYNSSFSGELEIDSTLLPSYCDIQQTEVVCYGLLIPPEGINFSIWVTPRNILSQPAEGIIHTQAYAYFWQYFITPVNTTDVVDELIFRSSFE